MRSCLRALAHLAHMIYFWRPSADKALKEADAALEAAAKAAVRLPSPATCPRACSWK